MEILSHLGSLALGCGLLFIGGEALVRGASAIALRFNISPLVIGLTVVAFGTSSPELAVSVQSSLNGEPDIALGNVVGSNICNILLILGLCALLRPLAVTNSLVRFDIPVMIAAAFATMAVAWSGEITRIEGSLLALSLVVYVLVLLRRSKQAALDIEIETFGTERPVIFHCAAISIGLVLLVIGADSFVAGAKELALLFGASELVIGLTVVAVGTSLPELATSLIATWRGEREIAVGNIFGSNIFNVFAVLGLSAIVAPLATKPSLIHIDIPVMLLVSLICIPVVFDRSISKKEGCLFLLSYCAYLGYQFSAA